MVMVMVTGIRVVVKQSAAPASATSQVHGSSDGGDTGNNRYRHTTNISECGGACDGCEDATDKA